MKIQLLFSVFLGGGLGCVARYALSEFIAGRFLSVVERFPIATFVVNTLGCLLIGLFAALFQNVNTPDWLRSMLIAGFCGGFTTFSTFSRENYTLMLSGEYFVAICYMALSFLLGLAAVTLGFYLGGRLAD